MKPMPVPETATPSMPLELIQQDPQMIFDHVARHLFTQGAPCVENRSYCEKGLCLLQDPLTGRSCALGSLLTPQDIERLKSKCGWDDHQWRYFGAPGIAYVTNDTPLLHWAVANQPLLHCLQRAHDIMESWESTATMRKRLRAVAEKRQLDPGVLDTLRFADR
jgi:hypothetical protein